MVVSYNLLSKFVDLEGISVQELVDKLTFTGLEVEGVSKLAEATGLVIGEILEVKDHPDSDHLHVLKIDEGPKRGIKQIVCGAKNVREHLHVIVATEGAILSKDKVKIVPSVIRGVESNGMCCSLLELGVDKSLLSDKQINGIEELNDDAPVGEEEVLKYLGLDDALIEINVLANRSDCLSIYSLAKEVAALFNRDLKIPTYKETKVSKATYKVTSNSNNCKQFSLRAVYGIKVKKSPKFLVEALRSSSIRSINNIVDIGNYVMLLTGRPLHMYDLDKINSKNFVVRDDLDVEFKALDEKNYHIQKDDLVVTDGENPLCLGGIMGGYSCMVDENSKNIGIECATFAPFRVRRTSTRIGLSSDSSSRFVKGIHPLNDEETIELTTHLLKELSGFDSCEEIVKYDVRDNLETKIECTYSYINHRLGTNISSTEMDKVFNALQIKIEHIDDDKFVAYPPSHRIDLKVDADLSEEIFRIIGINLIKPTLPITPMTLGGLNQAQEKKRIIREHLVSLGLNETLTYTLVSEKEAQEATLLTEKDECYKILNPMTQDHSTVRKSLLTSLINTVKYNHSRSNFDVAIFETSYIETKNNSFQDLCIVLNGNKFEQGLLKQRKYNFYDISGMFNSILNILGITANRIKIQPLTDSIYFHPGRSAKVLLNNKLIAVFGELHPTYLKNNDLDETFALELNLTSLLDLKSSALKMEQISKFQSVKRDYAFVIKKEISLQEIILAIKKRSSNIIKNIDVFDVYEGEHIALNYKSVAIRITYVSMDHTLKEQEINETEAKALDALKSLGAELRK